MADIKVHFKIGEYGADKFKEETDSTISLREEGNLLLAKIKDSKYAHLFYDTGTSFLNIIPETLLEENGGTGTDLTKILPYSVLIQNASREKIIGVTPLKGAFFATAANTSPKFGTLPADCGGTGNTTYTDKTLVYAHKKTDNTFELISVSNSIVGENSLTLGNINNTSNAAIKIQNNDGAVSLYTSGSRGLYDHGSTTQEAGWIVATDGADGHTFINAQNGKNIKFKLNGVDKVRITSGGNIQHLNSSQGYFLKDSAGNEYGGLYDNGHNLWVGTTQNASTHHVGGTYISSGFNTTDQDGNKTIYIAIPNKTNTNSSNYKVFHSGMISSNRINYKDSETELLKSSGHSINDTLIAINSTSTDLNYNLSVTGATGHKSGHVYLTGAKESNSTGNTTQLVFGTPGGESNINNHLALSSNRKALVINPNISSTLNQIVLYLEKASLFPGGINITSWVDSDGNRTAGDLSVQGDSTLTGTVYLKGGATASAILKGPTSTSTFYFPNTGGTLVTHATRGTAVGNTNRPVYIAATGRATICNTPSSGAWWQGVPFVSAGGVIEIGKHIDFHNVSTNTNDYSTRIDCASNTENVLTLPSGTGTLAILNKGNTDHWGIRGPANNDVWIRTTSNGFIPDQAGTVGSGHASLGTSSWYFANSYIDNMYVNLAASKIAYVNSNHKFVTMTNSIIGTNSLQIGDPVEHTAQSYVKAQNKNGGVSIYAHNARGLYNHGDGTDAKPAGWIVAVNTSNETFVNALPSTDIFFSSDGTKRARVTATGNMVLMNTDRGYFLIDSGNNEYPGVYDNGSNLWIGSKQSKSKHHLGGTYISAGHSGTSGNTTIKVSVPNAGNTDATNYDVYHSGMIIPTSNGGTGNSSFTANRVIYSSSATKLSSSGHYSNASKMAINSTSEPSYNFYVNGSTYLSGTAVITGNLSLGSAIYYTNGSYNSREMIRFKTGNNDGAGVVIGGGGLTVLGSGESATAVMGENNGDKETTFISSDNSIVFYSNCQTFANKHEFKFTEAGNFVCPKGAYLKDPTAAYHILYNKTDYTIVKGYNNGNITVNAASGDLYLGYVNTQYIRVNTRLIGLYDYVWGPSLPSGNRPHGRIFFKTAE